MTFTGTVPFTIRSRKRDHLFARLMSRPRAAVSLAIVIAIVVLVTFANFFAPIDPNQTDLHGTLAPPSWAHPLGTDAAGRDIWSRLLHGGQPTLIGALIVVVLSLVLGVSSGLLAGYYGKWFESGSMWVTSLIMALPAMIVLLAVRTAFGPNILLIMATFGVLIAPGYYLLVRNSVRGVRNELYVDAARVSGLSDARIISHHILTTVRAPLIIQSMMVAGLAIGIQAALDFLGVGSTTGPTWGGMLSDGFAQIYSAPQLMLWPALAIGLMTGALIVLGNEVRDAVEDRPTARRVSNAPREGSAVPAPQTGSGALLSVKGVTVGYAAPDRTLRTVVRDVSFDIDRGKVLGLVGESGSGKTQIAFSILGLLPDSASITGGGVFLDDVNLLTLGASARRRSRVGGVAYIPQEPMANLDPCFTIGDQLMEPLRIARGMSKKEAKQTALDLLASVAIADPPKTMKRYPHEISGGMAQRVLIAAALSLAPRVLVADEPTTALDVTVQAGVLALLRKLQREHDLAVLLVTHDLGVAAELCDDIVVLKEGGVVEKGSVEDVFYRPGADYTKKLLSATMADAPPRSAWTAPGSEAVA